MSLADLIFEFAMFAGGIIVATVALMIAGSVERRSLRALWSLVALASLVFQVFLWSAILFIGGHAGWSGRAGGFILASTVAVFVAGRACYYLWHSAPWR